jgi:hypothetical protein
MSKKIILSVFLFCTTLFYAQVGIGTTTPGQGAMLDIDSDNSGILIPRVELVATNSQTPIIAPTPETGLMVFNTATAGTAPNNVTPGFYYWEAAPSPGRWVRISSGASTDWALTGNAGTTPGTNFIGTTDAQPLRIRTNSTEQFEVTTDGRIRANNSGTQTSPTYSFDQNNNMGMYRQGNNDLRLATGGNGRFQITNTFLRSFQNHRFANGNADEPAITFNSSQSTGIYRPAADNLAFSTGGTERIRIDENGNVGINTIPSEILHVVGNLQLDGSFMPGGDAGNTDQILISKGPGNEPEWGPGFLNVASISNIGKFFTDVFDSNSGTYLTLTILDPNMTVDSVVSFNLTGPLPAGPQWGNNFRMMAQPRNGEVRFHITNVSGFDITGLVIAYTAFYN